MRSPWESAHERHALDEEVGYGVLFAMYQEWKYPLSNIQGRARRAVLTALSRREPRGDPEDMARAAKLLDLPVLRYMTGGDALDLVLKTFLR